MIGEENPSKEQQQGATQTPADAPTGQNGRVLAATEGSERQHQGNPSPCRLPTRPIEWLQIGINAALAVIAIGALCVYHAQLNAMKGQQKVMQDQVEEMRAEQRAWVSLTKDSGIEGLSINDASDLRSAVKFGLQNTGKNPAVSVFVSADMSIGTVIPHGSMDAWQAAVCGQPTGLGFTMFPGSPEPILSIDSGLTGTELAERKRLNAKLPPVLAPVIAACITYEDAVTKQTHHTPLAFEIRMKAPRPGHGCCAIVPSDLPLKEDEITLRPWVRGNLPPD